MRKKIKKNVGLCSIILVIFSCCIICTLYSIKRRNVNNEVYESFLIQEIPVIKSDNKEYWITDLIGNTEGKYLYCDIDGDGIDELHIKSDRAYFIIKEQKDGLEVLYEGSAYEEPINRNGLRGILYFRKGGAPTHDTYQYFSIDSGEVNKNILSFEWYDGNENELMDSCDIYLFNNEYISEEEWKEKTELYRENVGITNEWCVCHTNNFSDATTEEAMVEESRNEERQTESQTGKLWIQEYKDKLCGDEFVYEKYALIFVDGDEIPELLGNNLDSAFQIISFSEEGKSICYEKMLYGTYSREYYYLPGQNSIISTCTGNNGLGSYEEYYIVDKEELKYQMTIGKIAQRDSEGKFLYDDEGNYVWRYEIDEIGITEEEWESLSMFDESYINFNHLEYYSQEEMINILSTY